MSYQAPWRIDAVHRRRCGIRERHDPVLNDPKVPKADRDFHRDQLRRNIGMAQQADERAGDHPGTVVLREAMAHSDEHEAVMHGGTRWDVAGKGK